MSRAHVGPVARTAATSTARDTDRKQLAAVLAALVTTFAEALPVEPL
ncbi:MAG: hypothetical protein ACXVRY_01915 [Gaiellaceae bacterium]